MTDLSERPERVTMQPVLTLDTARSVLHAAEAETARRHLRLAFAVTDPSGDLIAFIRMDGIHAGTVEVAVAKARTAALFGKPTRTFADAIAGGATGILSLPNMVTLPGGVPLFWRGACVGAIGVSVASPDIDAAVAEAGAAQLEVGD
jgi:glc operon protein GlcG